MISQVLEILAEHRDGLTWTDVIARTGFVLPRYMLTQFQAEGYVKQRRKLLPDGRIVNVYVLGARAEKALEKRE